MKTQTTDEVLSIIHDIYSPLCALKGLAKCEDRNEALEKQAYSRFFELAKKLRIHYSEERKEEINYLLDTVEMAIAHKEMENPKVVFSVNCDPFLRDLVFDFESEQLERSISNVLNNSIEAGATQIILKIAKKKNCIQLKVTDNGVGFFATEISQVKSKVGFTTKSNGQGIGLSSSINFMNSIEGDFKILSTPYIGSNIIMSFPRLLFTSLDYGPLRG